jgi:hypothetical protein
VPTYPWLRVYPEELLGDVKARQLEDYERWYLILAWHMARNGPVPGELRNDDGTIVDRLAFSKIAGCTAKRANIFLCKIMVLGLAVPTADGCVTFPNLAAAQGDDAREARREAGRRGAESRWQSDGKPHGKPMAKPIASPLAKPMAGDAIPIPIHQEVEGHTHSTGTDPRGNDLLVKDLKIPADVRYEIERIVQGIPHGGRSLGRLVKAAQAGASARCYADAWQGYQAAGGGKTRPGAYICGIVEDNMRKWAS